MKRDDFIHYSIMLLCMVGGSIIGALLFKTLIVLIRWIV